MNSLLFIGFYSHWHVSSVGRTSPPSSAVSSSCLQYWDAVLFEALWCNITARFSWLCVKHLVEFVFCFVFVSPVFASLILLESSCSVSSPGACRESDCGSSCDADSGPRVSCRRHCPSAYGPAGRWAWVPVGENVVICWDFCFFCFSSQRYQYSVVRENLGLAVWKAVKYYL